MKKSFTLVELLVVIAIIGLLSAVLVPRLSNVTRDTETTVSEYNAAQIERQLEAFRAANGVYPSTFHTGYDELGSTNVAKMPGAIACNYTGIGEAMPVAGLYSNGANAYQMSKPNVGGQAFGSSRCGVSLQRAGITRVIVGDAADSSLNYTNTVDMNSADVKLLHANGFFANSIAATNEIKIKGKTLREYYGKPCGGIEAVTCVIPLYITDRFAWVAMDAAGSLKNGGASIGIMGDNKNSVDGYQYIAFFACDMLPQNGGRDQNDPRPAELLGVVSVKDIIK